jgi:acyl-CoA hydrolase
MRTFRRISKPFLKYEINLFSTLRKGPKIVSADEAVKVIQNGERIFLHTGVMGPDIIVQALIRRANELRGVEIFELHSSYGAEFLKPEFSESFHTYSMFFHGNERQGMNRLYQKNYAEDDKERKCSVDYVPMFMSEIGKGFYNGTMPVDTCFIQVTPPDRFGNCSIGVNCDVMPGAVENCKRIIAQVNNKVPRTFGYSVKYDNIDYVVEHDIEIAVEKPGEIKKEEMRIGEIIAGLIPDRACIQVGIGAIPNAVLLNLKNHKDLGIHTEMFSDGLVELYKSGAITGRYKKIFPSKIVTGFVKGTKKVYDFVDGNPEVLFERTDVLNDPFNIMQNEKMIAINSALEIDLTGQVCADSVGTKFHSGVGGQVDYMYGASRSIGGKSIFAIPSISSKGHSKIVPTIKLGGGIVTTRAHVHWVVTEYGAVNLYGKSLRERAALLISISHPSVRQSLWEEAMKRFGHCGTTNPGLRCLCKCKEDVVIKSI